MSDHKSASTCTFTCTVYVRYDDKIIGYVKLNCIAYKYRYDGSLRDIDIDTALFDGNSDNDIAGYVSAAQPDLWDEWMVIARSEYVNLEHVTGL